MVKRITQTILLSLICSRICFANPIVNNAVAELGKGEHGSNNKGQYIRQYMKGKEGLSWCAGFTSYVLTKSGITKLGYCFGAKQIYNKAKELKWITNKPTAGCLIVFWRGKRNSWKGHIGIIEKVTDDKIYTIEGNVGKYPAKVKRFEYSRDNIPRLLGFIEVQDEHKDIPETVETGIQKF